jgi:hypothetical protein
MTASSVWQGCSTRDEQNTLFCRIDSGDLPSGGLTYGATLLDWDGDGWRDLLMSRHSDRAEIYLNRGGLRFAALGAADVLPAAVPDQHGSSACDFDRDGDWDVYITLGAEHGQELSANQLWRQERPGQYLNVLKASDPLCDPVGRGRSALWADVNGDLAPDLLLMNYQSQALLFQQGDGQWRDATVMFPTPASVPLWNPAQPPPDAEERARSTWLHAPIVADFDRDGLIDIVALGRPGLSGMWRNNQGQRFQDTTCAWGLSAAFWPHVPQHGCAGDVDEDGDLDLVLLYRKPVRNVAAPVEQIELWLNMSESGLLQFRRSDADCGLTGGQIILAGLLADLNNDSHLDLYVVQNGPQETCAENLILLGNGDGSFRPLDTGRQRHEEPPRGLAESALAADLDRDGDLDLLALNGGGVEADSGGGVILYENTSARSKGLTLELTSQIGAPHGLGARLELVLDGRTQVREVHCLATPTGANILPVHFGVGRQAGPFRVRIQWASGTTQEVTLPRAGTAYLVREETGAAVELPRKL